MCVQLLHFAFLGLNILAPCIIFFVCMRSLLLSRRWMGFATHCKLRNSFLSLCTRWAHLILTFTPDFLLLLCRTVNFFQPLFRVTSKRQLILRFCGLTQSSKSGPRVGRSLLDCFYLLLRDEILLGQLGFVTLHRTFMRHWCIKVVLSLLRSFIKRKFNIWVHCAILGPQHTDFFLKSIFAFDGDVFSGV